MPTEIDGKTYLSVSEIASQLNCSGENVRRYIRDGRLKAFVRGKKTFMVEQTDFSDFLSTRPAEDLVPYERK